MYHLQQWRDSGKRRGKKWVFLSKQCLETQVMACSGFRNGIIQFSMLTKKKHTHICSTSHSSNWMHKWWRSKANIRKGTVATTVLIAKGIQEMVIYMQKCSLVVLELFKFKRNVFPFTKTLIPGSRDYAHNGSCKNKQFWMASPIMYSWPAGAPSSQKEKRESFSPNCEQS